MHLMDWEQEIVVMYYECVVDCDELGGRCPPYICPQCSQISLSIESSMCYLTGLIIVSNKES